MKIAENSVVQFHYTVSEPGRDAIEIDTGECMQCGQCRVEVVGVKRDLLCGTSQLELLIRWTELRNGGDDIAVTGEILRQFDVGVGARRLAAGKENERKMFARERRIAMCCGW